MVTDICAVAELGNMTVVKKAADGEGARLADAPGCDEPAVGF